METHAQHRLSLHGESQKRVGNRAKIPLHKQFVVFYAKQSFNMIAII